MLVHCITVLLFLLHISDAWNTTSNEWNLSPVEEEAFLHWVNVQTRSSGFAVGQTHPCTWPGITCWNSTVDEIYDGISSMLIGQWDQSQLIYGELPDLLLWEQMKINGTGFTNLTSLTFYNYRFGPYIPDYTDRMWTNKNTTNPNYPWNLEIRNNQACSVLCPMPDPFNDWVTAKARNVGCTNITIIEIQPTFGPRTGGTEVTMWVNAPLGFVSLRCSFGAVGMYGDNLTVPTPVSEMYFTDYYWHDYDVPPNDQDSFFFGRLSAVTTILKCRSPPHPAGPVDMRIVAHMTDGSVVLLTRSNTSIFFSYECPSGTETDIVDGKVQCYQCPPGTWSRGAHTKCSLCPPGSYTDKNGSTTCSLCPSGTFGNISGQASADLCFSCEPGSFADKEGHSICDKCVPGTAQGSEGQNRCDFCLAGFVAPGYGNKNCVQCPKGTFSTDPTKECVFCPVGTFTTANGSGVCATCAPGTTTSDAGGSECDVKCAPGFYRSFDIQRCVSCPPGRYTNLSGSVVCQLCPQNTFNPSYNATYCTECPPTYKNTQRGATMCYKIPPPPPATNQIGQIIGIILLILALIGILILIIIIIKKRRELKKKQNEIEEIRTIMEGLKNEK